MCPGGQIVASVHQPGLLCTNGMSNSRHSSGFANAALVVTLGPRELGEDRWAGVAFQEALERAAFVAGGGDYTAPAQRAPDFLAGRESRSLGATSYRFGVRPGRLDELLPAPVRDALRRRPRAFRPRDPRLRFPSRAARRRRDAQLRSGAPAARRGQPPRARLRQPVPGGGGRWPRRRHHERRDRRRPLGQALLEHGLAG